MNPFGKSKSKTGSLANASQPSATDPSVVTCPKKQKLHLVKVKLVFKDDQKAVPAATCKILKGVTEVNGGPLAAGELASGKVLEAGSYEVTFPDIDAAEWSAG